MKKHLLIILLLNSICSLVFAQDTSYNRQDTNQLARDTNRVKQDSNYIVTYHLGDSILSFHSTCFIPCESNIIYLNIHDNENTSVEAAEVFLPRLGGMLFQIKHSGGRLISFNLKDKVYTMDPNRIFSSAGRKATLQKNSTYNLQAAEQIKSFADYLLKGYVCNRNLVIALHNNTDSLFSIESYKTGGDEAKATELLYINPEMDPDDFVLTTEQNIYDHLKEKQISVVLQSKKAPDDGSLSVYAQKKNIPYINVEAQADHLEEQARILEALTDIIKAYQ